MRTFTTCMQCQVESGMPNFSSLSMEDVPESGVIEVTCNRGHRTALIIQQTKFEILSEMGVKAIVNGSYRDAVSSFASSLERLHEFFLEASCRRHGIAPDDFTVTWKHIANQSERQLGAFLAAYLLDTRKTAKVLPPKQVEFRNAVIHKGRLATRDEAVRFGQAMFDCAIPVLMLLRSDPYAEILRKLTFERIRARSSQAVDAGIPTSTMGISTPLSFINAEQTDDLEAIIDCYATRPDMEQAIRESHNLGAMIDSLIGATADKNTTY